jgi:hypothetical protein
LSQIRWEICECTISVNVYLFGDNNISSPFVHIDSQEVKVNFVGGLHHIGYFESRSDAINANNLARTYLETFIDDDLSPKRIEKHVDMIREAIRLLGGIHLSQDTGEYVSEVATCLFRLFLPSQLHPLYSSRMLKFGTLE